MLITFDTAMEKHIIFKSLKEERKLPLEVSETFPLYSNLVLALTSPSPDDRCNITEVYNSIFKELSTKKRSKSIPFKNNNSPQFRKRTHVPTTKFNLCMLTEQNKQVKVRIENGIISVIYEDSINETSYRVDEIKIELNCDKLILSPNNTNSFSFLSEDPTVFKNLYMNFKYNYKI